ncbi:MAG: MarR family transcriptional regulator [Clostridiales bacterium]|nr:MarR family transcriptional regulator [Clostridiales bacterium]MDY5347080.1 MarR family transcriptional regulator [Eubacteriales bacterium]
MFDSGITPMQVFNNANRFIEAYHTVLHPLCKATGLPPMAVDILMFAANNPPYATARNICQYRGLKPGIVSVHVERLVSEGFLTRQPVPGDRRQTLLVCTEKALPFVTAGKQLQKEFTEQLLNGISESDLAAFRKALIMFSKNIDEIQKKGSKKGV